MGVWIETPTPKPPRKAKKSHPSWVCGLKLWHCPKKQRLVLSHPSWVCGLKQEVKDTMPENLRSHPSWVCGLKQNAHANEKDLYNVTPFVGVWIETEDMAKLKKANLSHPSWVCGLKHVKCKLRNSRIRSHPSWVCGLKQECPNDTSGSTSRHTLRGCVD